MRILDFPSDDCYKAIRAAVELREEFCIRVASGSRMWSAVNNTLPLLVTRKLKWRLSIRAIADAWRLKRLYEESVYARLDTGYVVSAEHSGDIILHFIPDKTRSA